MASLANESSRLANAVADWRPSITRRWAHIEKAVQTLRANSPAPGSRRIASVLLGHGVKDADGNTPDRSALESAVERIIYHES